MTRRAERRRLTRSTVCPCGGVIQPRIIHEQLVDHCTRCHSERLVEIHRPPGFVRYDQRAQLEQDLTTKAEHVRRGGKARRNAVLATPTKR